MAGGVLSPHLFAAYVDSLVDVVERCNIGCCVKCVSIVLYADDILLLSPSVTGPQQLLRVCKQELDLLDIHLYTAPRYERGVRSGRCGWVNA